MVMKRQGRGPTRQNHITDLIARLGGQHAVAAGLGLSQAAVSGWAVRGFVPSHNIPRVIAFGEQLDPPVRLTPCHFFAAAPGSAESPCWVWSGLDPSRPPP
jgi:hypothetical protein